MLASPSVWISFRMPGTNSHSRERQVLWSFLLGVRLLQHVEEAEIRLYRVEVDAGRCWV